MKVIIESDSTQMLVLTYLKKKKFQNKEFFDRLMVFGVKPNDIIKFIERPEECGKWPFDFVCQVTDVINKISKNFLIDFPIIETQTEEDRVLSKLLKKNNFLAFSTNTFFGQEVTVHHVITYMQRDETINLWNADFVFKTQQEVKRVKKFLLQSDEY